MRALALTRRRFVAGLATAGALAAVGGHAVGSRVVAQGQETAPAGQAEAPRLIPTLCGMCDAHCGVVAYVKDGHLIKLEGNHSHSHSHGRICTRGSAGVKLLYDPDRLQAPLKRVADGKFARIPWEQAFTEIGQALVGLRDKHGPESLAWVRHPDLSDDWDRRFAAAFGTPNLFTPAATAQSARTIACRATMGWLPVSDLRRAKFILVCGRNFAEAVFPADLEALMAAKEAGARIVCLDPRLSNTAAQAHEWLPIRPGADGALLLGIMNVLVQEGLYDRQFVAAYVAGFAELQEYLADKTPGWAATETDIPASTITRLAREMAAARPAVVDMGRHGAWGALYANSLNTARLALALNALLGSYGVPGGIQRPLAAQEGLGRLELPEPPAPMAPRADGADKYEPALLLPGEGLVHALPQIVLSQQPYPIKALVARHWNPLHSLPNSGKVAEALRKLDLLVVIDVLPSDTAQLAHYVLPESTYLERFEPPVQSRLDTPEVAVRQPVVEPLFDTKSPAAIVAGLAKASGLGSFFEFTPEDVAAARLQPLGVTLAKLRDSGVWRPEGQVAAAKLAFATPSGKIEITSQRLREAGFDELPVYRPPSARPEGGNSFRLLHGRVAQHSGSATQNNAWLHALSHENRLHINADRAARLGIRDGDEVVVRSEVGEVRVRAHVTEGIHPQAVFLAHGYGTRNVAQRLAAGCGVNDNDLVVDRLDAAAASAATCETIVRVAKA